jgi:type IV fimbrial biogenesis protein FimT
MTTNKRVQTTATKQAGLTLIELMVVLVLAGIIMAAGVPAFNELMKRTRMNSEFDQSLGNFAFARSEAVKRNQSVSVCPSDDQSTCTGTSWNNDWLIFVDDGNGGGTADNRDRDGSETILRVRQARSADFTVNLTNFTDNGGVLFGGDGKMEDADLNNVGELILCDDRGEESAKGLAFSAFGQFRLMRDTDSSGVVDYANDAGTTVDVICP